jgi:hypothetical protein
VVDIILGRFSNLAVLSSSGLLAFVKNFAGNRALVIGEAQAVTSGLKKLNFKSAVQNPTKIISSNSQIRVIGHTMSTYNVKLLHF